MSLVSPRMYGNLSMETCAWECIEKPYKNWVTCWGGCIENGAMFSIFRRDRNKKLESLSSGHSCYFFMSYLLENLSFTTPLSYCLRRLTRTVALYGGPLLMWEPPEYVASSFGIFGKRIVQGTGTNDLDQKVRPSLMRFFPTELFFE